MTDSPVAPDPAADNTDSGAPVEPWRWHLESPEEVARLARLLTRRPRVVECVSTGESMGETLPAGTRLRVRCGSVEPRVGDVVVVLAGPTDLVAHRVVARGSGRRGRRYLVTRGDNSVLCDQPVRADAVLGVVEARWATGGWQDVAGPFRRPRAVAVAAGLHRAITLGTLALAPGLAIRLAAASYAVTRPFRSLGARRPD